MSAQDRIAGIVAEHEWRPQSTAWYEPYGACGCGHNTAQDGDWKPYDVGCWVTHVAAVLASAANLAVAEHLEYAVMARSGRPNMDGSTAYVQVIDRLFRFIESAQEAADRHPNPDVVVCKRRVTAWEEVAS